MDQARLVNAVFDPDAKGLADLGRYAEGPVWLPDAVDRRRLAVHPDVAALEPKDCRRRRGAVRRGLRSGENWRRGQGRNAARNDRASDSMKTPSTGLRAEKERV